MACAGSTPSMHGPACWVCDASGGISEALVPHSQPCVLLPLKSMCALSPCRCNPHGLSSHLCGLGAEHGMPLYTLGILVCI